MSTPGQTVASCNACKVCIVLRKFVDSPPTTIEPRGTSEIKYNEISIDGSSFESRIVAESYEYVTDEAFLSKPTLESTKRLA